MSQFEKYILIGTAKLENIFLKAKENEPTIVPKLLGFFFGIFVTLLITTITLTIQHPETEPSTPFPTHIVIFWTITVALAIAIIILFFSRMEENIAYLKSSHTFDRIRQQIEDSSECKREYTLIILDIKERKSKIGEMICIQEKTLFILNR
jgi:uncharacterized protein YacL